MQQTEALAMRENKLTSVQAENVLSQNTSQQLQLSVDTQTNE